MRSEQYWNRREASEFPSLDLLHRPLGLVIDGQRFLHVDPAGSSDLTGLVVAAREDGVGVLIGFRAVPFRPEKTYRGTLVISRILEATATWGRAGIPVYRIGKPRFVRVCQRSCPYLLIPTRPRATRDSCLAPIKRICDTANSPCGTLIWIPFRQGGVELVLQEFPDTLALASRELGEGKRTATRISVLPYYDWSIGELMERCGSPRIERVDCKEVGGQRMPIRQFLTVPTARLRIAQSCLAGPGDAGTEAISTEALRSMRLLSFDLAKELPTETKAGKAGGALGIRLVLLDQGGAEEAVVRTEPRMWRPTVDRTALVVSNDIKFLTIVMNRGLTYHMRSEAVDDFRTDEWSSREHFVLNDLSFAGEKPSLAPGDLATFVLETGQPERVRSMMGSMMRVVTKPKVVSVRVFIAWARETDDGRLYVDGYRSTGGLTAVPLVETNPVRLLRGGRLRWRPRMLPPEALLRLAKAGRFPFVYEDEGGAINVAVSLMPPGRLAFPPGPRANERVGAMPRERREIKADYPTGLDRGCDDCP